MNGKQWMIYGANGFSGALIAREAVRQNLKPILAGRNRAAIANLAQELNLEYRILGLNEPQKLKGIRLLLNCAGPFKATAKILAKSCILSGVHYLDISGELAAFEELFTLSDAAKAKQIILLPGVGFFVAATDGLIALLKEQVPDADSIELSLIVEREFRFNTGSIKSILDIFNETYINTKITPFSPSKKMIINGQEFNTLSLVLPDLFTGHLSTGISRIRIYGHFREFSWLFNEMPWLLSNLAALMKYFSIFKTHLYNIIDLLPQPEVCIYAANSGVLLQGEASNQEGRVFQRNVKLDNPYLFTQKSALLCIKKILNRENIVASGFQTPSLIFRENLLLEILRDMQ
jgi:short subunit dehydrogenase-like uncharacterized protein